MIQHLKLLCVQWGPSGEDSSEITCIRVNLYTCMWLKAAFRRDCPLKCNRQGMFEWVNSIVAHVKIKVTHDEMRYSPHECPTCLTRECTWQSVVWSRKLIPPNLPLSCLQTKTNWNQKPPKKEEKWQPFSASGESYVCNKQICTNFSTVLHIFTWFLPSANCQPWVRPSNATVGPYHPLIMNWFHPSAINHHPDWIPTRETG